MPAVGLPLINNRPNVWSPDGKHIAYLCPPASMARGTIYTPAYMTTPCASGPELSRV